MQLWKKISDLIVNKSLALTKGASLTLTDPNGVSTPVNPFVKTKVAAFTVPTSENGMTYILSLAAGFATTLPAPFAGAKYKFIVGISNTGSHTIVATGAIVTGTIASSDLNAANDVAAVAAATTITLAANVSIKGDYVELVSDGTAWFISGCTQAYNAVTAA